MKNDEVALHYPQCIFFGNVNQSHIDVENELLTFLLKDDIMQIRR